MSTPARNVTVGGGVWRGRNLRYPASADVRPTMQRTKASLFGALAPRLAAAVFVDLYAGAGAVGIEALSRGAARVHFVECRPEVVRLLHANLAGLGVDAERARVHAATVAHAVDSPAGVIADATIVFADPPYDVDVQADLLDRFRVSRFPDLECLVVEHRVKRPLVAPPRLRVERERRFGETVVTYLVPVRAGPADGGHA